MVLPRLRELEARREELSATLAKVVPLTSPPSHLYAETTIARFQQTIRDLFLGADQTLAKNYLRFLVDRIDVKGNELNVHGKTGAAVALLAEPARPVNPTEVVLTSAGGWLAKRSISRTWNYAEIPPLPAPVPLQGPSPHRAATRARHYAREMADNGLTRAGLARKLGVSRAWVTKALRSLPDGEHGHARLVVADREHSG